MTKSKKLIFWTPRIILIAFILFLALFSLDIFGNNYTFFEAVIGLVMHNIPSIILLIVLLISWKHDLFGAIVFLALGILCFFGIVLALAAAEGGMFNPILIIGSIVFLIIGFLFLAGWKRGKKK